MAAKMIFYKHPETGEKTMQFCPLVQVGCEKCFLPKRCKGESDPCVAFRLDLTKKPYRMIGIRVVKTMKRRIWDDK